MSVSYVKFCPRCQTTTAVETAICPKCGHHFRTHFQPPVSEKTMAMTSASPRPEAGNFLDSEPSVSRPVSTSLRPRSLLVLLVIALAAAALYGGFRLSHGRDRVGPTTNVSQTRAFTAYDVVFKGAPQDAPLPLATHSPEDLQRWQETAGKTATDEPTASDSPARVHLYLSGQIALIPAGTPAQVLQEQGEWRRIRVSQGPHQGISGYVKASDLVRPSVTTIHKATSSVG